MRDKIVSSHRWGEIKMYEDFPYQECLNGCESILFRIPIGTYIDHRSWLDMYKDAGFDDNIAVMMDPRCFYLTCDELIILRVLE